MKMWPILIPSASEIDVLVTAWCHIQIQKVPRGRVQDAQAQRIFRSREVPRFTVGPQRVCCAPRCKVKGRRRNSDELGWKWKLRHVTEKFRVYQYCLHNLAWVSKMEQRELWRRCHNHNLSRNERQDGRHYAKLFSRSVFQKLIQNKSLTASILYVIFL